MKNNISIIFIVVLTLLCGCQKESKPIKKITLKKLYECDATALTDSLKTPSTSCLTSNGTVFLLIPSKTLLLEINRYGIINKKIDLCNLQYGGLRSPSCIQSYNNNIIISDISSKLIIFYDKNLNVLKSVKLYGYPLKFRIVNDNIYYLADEMNKVSQHEQYYSYKIFRHNMITNVEKEMYKGETINILSLRKELNLNTPKTIDFCLSNNEKLYCVVNSYDNLCVERISDNAHRKVINDDKWVPIPYESVERKKYISYLKSYILRSYPVEKIKIDYKLSINSMTTDSYGNLWLVTASRKNEIPIRIYSNDYKSCCCFSIKGYSVAQLNLQSKYLLVSETNPFNYRAKFILYEYRLF
ncbi:hypothetical protein [Prevotella sp. TCVGH]|jgi:hypothetical protein|uniref:hypothetical protein n=1 Tax=Prevotella sp. TCVGH TaxID=2182433 RepID=UPI00201E2C91|nr:hypothetical protein [Prevotella sp. TCVGH]